MSTLANPTEMIRRGAPRLIHSDEELAMYTEALIDLTARAHRSHEDEEAIGLLTLLIERYESEHFVVPDAEPTDVLRFLLDQNGLSQRDIADELGGESTVSLILSGKRQLNRNHIAQLSNRFNVSPAIFFGVQRRTPTAKDEFFIERREQGDYAIRRSGSGRASAVLPTRAEAIKRASEMNPKATVRVERVRNTNVGSRDKWRKP